jgi:hypothetical protein
MSDEWTELPGTVDDAPATLQLKHDDKSVLVRWKTASEQGARSIDGKEAGMLIQLVDAVRKITDYTTRELLAEVERRQLAERPPVVHFFGVWPGERAGHYRRERSGKMTNDHGDGIDGRQPLGLYPWDVFHGPAAPQIEGKFWTWRHQSKPLTLLLSWDRSADHRGGCCATFIIHEHVTDERALDLAREAFPAVFARIEAHLGRSVELAGLVPDEGSV